MTTSTTPTTSTWASGRWLRLGPLRCLAVLLAAAGFVLLVAGPASAHVGDSPAADNFSGSVTSVSPALPGGVSVEIIEFGNRLRLVNTSDEIVAVPGYSAEPYLQIGPEGVRRNENSPATYLNLNRDGTTPLPSRADPLAQPSWVTISDVAVYEWHDHRTHWMSALLPPDVRADPAVAHQVIEWTIPLEIGGSVYEVSGVLDWTPPPPGWVSYLVLFGLAAVGVGAGWIRRSPRLSAGLLVVACAGSVWHVVSTPLAQGSTSSVLYAAIATLLPSLLVVVVTFFAVRAARRLSGSRSFGATPYLFAIAGWLLVVEALPDLDVLFRANISAVGPAWTARLAVLLLLGLGVGLALGAIGLLRAQRKVAAEPVGAVATDSGVGGPELAAGRAVVSSFGKGLWRSW